MRRIKKLKKNDINKNNYIEKKYTINKIKEKEGKYMTILVVFFMILFLVIGYYTLTVNKDNYDEIKNHNSRVVSD